MSALNFDEEEVQELLREMEFFSGDDSYVFHVANYFIGRLKEQYPKLFPKEQS